MKRLQRMPGASYERPRACKLNDIEPHVAKDPAKLDSTSPLSSAGSMGSVARFPKLDECAHFHYEHVELGNLEVSMSAPEEQPSGSFAVRVTSGDACWSLQRSYSNFVMFDKQLHRCIFDRQFSMLADLSEEEGEEDRQRQRLVDYLRRFSSLSHEGLNCGPVLNWLQLDNRGRRILVPEADSCPINTPAVAAAYAVRPYQAQAQDEISFQVGDMISVIDMPPAGESSWWRGKHGFAVGFFPAECVAVIGDKLPRHLALQHPGRRGPSLQPIKPVLRKHGKLIAFFRSFILNRPSRRRLKQSGILRERVFGCDLGEHLLNSAQDVPNVLSCCAEFIERHGLVDGIYRLSGVTSNIQRLRHAFDEDRVPALHSDESILQDIHSVASLLKMYFRELPNPLCTYQLYSTFVNAVQSASDTERLRRMRDAVRKLPPPHYRTLEYLMRHLVRVAARGEETGMTPRNVAIVWAPNLLRCKELEVGGVAALQGVGVQAVVTEFLICYAELIFAPGPTDPTTPDESTANTPTSGGQRPKSLAIASNSSRLLSLEEARNRSILPEAEAIDVGPGPAGLPLRYHTVIELPQGQRKRNGSKRSPSLNWRALFGGKTNGPARQGPKTRTSSAKAEITITRPQELVSATGSLRRLRPAKSADSLEGNTTGTEDGLGPLLGPTAAGRTCGHSRSVSHDSYFEHLGDAGSAASASSPLDLSEIQLSFELEEREMRMLSEEESGGRPSLEASPRRQLGSAPESGSSGGPPAGGGSKRKRSRLEERLHCDVELRFIDSQSPDQVMVSADVHEMESPSPLPTPGYLPLLSEGSTPLTPAASPAAVSPRISFKSFMLPLDVGEPILTKDSKDTSRATSCLIKTPTESEKSSGMEACEIVDQEMTPCERLCHGLEENKTEKTRDDAQGLLDSLMPYENAPVTNFEKTPTPSTPNYNDDLQSSEKWLMADSSSDSLAPQDTEENRLQRTTDNLKLTQILSVEDCQSSAPKNCQELMCYTDIESSDQTANSNFDSYCEKENLNDGNKVDLLNSVPSETEFLRLTDELDPNQTKSSTCLVEANIKNFSNQVESELSSWDVLLDDKSLRETNQNDKDKCTNESQDQGDRFYDKGKCDMETLALILDPQINVVESSTCDESKESQKSQAVEQVANCNRICSPHTNVKIISQESSSTNAVQDSRIQEDVVVPSESAAVEPQEMAHVPEFTEGVSFSPPSDTKREPIVHKDTATILQELAYQRLSGGGRVEPIPTRRRYDIDRDRRSFDSEIGREIVREHKMKQELENARGKLDDSLTSNHGQTVSATHLPPCLRARHARAIRATLSRSLDEAKFNKMTANAPRGKQSEGGSTPSVIGKSTPQLAERSKNLGLDLDDPRCRERIEKYKEERRTFLRDKYRSESFRDPGEEGEQALLARLKQRASRPSLL